MAANSIDDQSSHPLTIYTIGHSNVPANKIVELLKSQRIDVLIDVRSSPYSKYVSQFNREMFQSVLKQAGINYKFAGEYLGGRPKDPTCYKSGQLPAGHVDFLHEVDYPAVMTKEWYQKGINRLLEIASEARTAFMCSEEDPARCHRQHLISQTLLRQGVEVLHIRGNGLLQKAWLLSESPTQMAEEKQIEQLDLLSAVKDEQEFAHPPIEEQEEERQELIYEPANDDWDWSAADSFFEHPNFKIECQPSSEKREGSKPQRISQQRKQKKTKEQDQNKLF